jgi:CRP-like cAMP-binding protein
MSRMNHSSARNQHIYRLLFEHLQLQNRSPLLVPERGVILPGGQVSRHMYCLAKGQAHVELYPNSADGARVIPMSFHPGMVLLVHTAYDDRPDPGTIVASQDCTLYTVTHDEFRQVMHARVEHLEVVTQFLAYRLTEARRREQQWIERGVQERLALTLDYMAAERSAADTRAAAKAPVVLNVTHELVAERSGLSRSKVSKELKRLEQAGHLRLSRSGIEIVNREALNPN